MKIFYFVMLEMPSHCLAPKSCLGALLSTENFSIIAAVILGNFLIFDDHVWIWKTGALWINTKVEHLVWLIMI